MTELFELERSTEYSDGGKVEAGQKENKVKEQRRCRKRKRRENDDEEEKKDGEEQ